MNATEEIFSFNQVWKDFLLVRPFTKSAQITISRDSKKQVIKVAVFPLKGLEKNGKHYITDDVSYPSVVLAFPREIVEDAVNVKIFQKLINKTLTDEQLEILKNKLNWDAKKTESRLGCANPNEIQQALLKKSFWEVLFSLHQLIEYRLHKLLIYKSSEIDNETSVITVNKMKQKICNDIQSFSHLVEIVFLIGAITNNERLKILSFDGERDNIAHKLLTHEVTDGLLESACKHGIELLDILQNAVQRIVPKPEMIIMDSFLIHEFI